MASPLPDMSTESGPGQRDDDACSGPAVIIFNRRTRWMARLRKILNILLGGPLDKDIYGKCDGHTRSYHAGNGKHLSSIEMDPDEDSHYRAGASFDSSSTSTSSMPKDQNGRRFENWRRCFTMKGYAFLVACIELLGLLYLMTTSVVIYTKDPMWSWFFQPFVAPLWFRHPTLLFSAACIFCVAGFIGVICLMQALDDAKRSPKLMIPHLLLQMLTIFGSLVLSLVSVVLLMTKGTFALRILDLAGSSLGNGVMGIGNIILGLERDRLASTTVHNILLGAGITPAPIRYTTVGSNFSDASPTPSTVAPSAVHYNVIGAIWEAFNYEIAMIVALIVYGTICVVEVFAWLLIRQLYASHVTKEHRRKGGSDAACQNVRSRRRYYSGDTPV